MKIFVIGYSGIGKTPFAKKVAEKIGGVHVSAGAWVREQCKLEPGLSRKEAVDRMTRSALVTLRSDPFFSATKLQWGLPTDRIAVIDGVRNPTDFVHLYDPRTDIAVFLHYTGQTYHVTPTMFERGVPLIREYLEWLYATTIMAPWVDDHPRFLEYSYSKLRDSDDDAQANGGNVKENIRQVVRVRADLPGPFQCYVREDFLYDMDTARTETFRPCKVVAVTSYPGSPLTFDILVDGVYAFHYIPIHALGTLPGGPNQPLELHDLVYHDCRSTDICVTSLSALQGQTSVFFKRKNQWFKGDYLFTVDWYGGNDLLHCLQLENGQYALLPSHKIQFGGEAAREFPDFKKLHSVWQVGDPRSIHVGSLDRAIDDFSTRYGHFLIQ